MLTTTGVDCECHLAFIYSLIQHQQIKYIRWSKGWTRVSCESAINVWIWCGRSRSKWSATSARNVVEQNIKSGKKIYGTLLLSIERLKFISLTPRPVFVVVMPPMSFVAPTRVVFTLSMRLCTWFCLEVNRSVLGQYDEATGQSQPPISFSFMSPQNFSFILWTRIFYLCPLVSAWFCSNFFPGVLLFFCCTTSLRFSWGSVLFGCKTEWGSEKQDITVTA